MKKYLIEFVISFLGFSLCFSYSINHDVEGISRVRYAYQDIPGYIFFEGFDFNGYKAESDGIEPMLEKTLGGNE